MKIYRKFISQCLLAWLSLAVITSHLHAATSAGFDRLLINQLLARVPPGQEEIFVGDMGFKVSYLRSLLETLNKAPSGASVLSASPIGITQWPGGIVPYAFNGNVNSTQQQQWIAACQEWEKYANLKFVRRTNEANYLKVNNSTVNTSFMGKQGGGQTVNIISWDWKYIICHEIGHAMGFCHEQCRSDRDTYLTIFTSNILAGEEHNFDKLKTSNKTPYDFNSVMHYGPTDFSRNGSNTLEANPGYQATAVNMGQRDYLSYYDKLGMVAMYGGPNLQFWKPNGANGWPSWQDDMMLSNAQGSAISQSNFTQADTIFIGVAPWNGGSIPLPSAWQLKVFLNGAEVQTRSYNAGLGINNAFIASDLAIGPLPPGTHVIRVVLDALNDNAEVDETAASNERTRTITVSGTAPTVTTAPASGVTFNSATAGGNVTGNGGGTVTERGVVYATFQNPATNNGVKVYSGSGTGAFSSNLTSLAPSTTYYLRAYAINAAGTAYGAQISFATQGITLTPPLQSFTAAAGSGSFNVAASGSWSWTQSPGSGSWLATSEAASQTGNQTFSYAVSANASAVPRRAAITLTSGSLTATHTVIQAGTLGGMGSVVAWGYDNGGQTVVPANLTNVIAVTAGSNHVAALRADGTVAAWGSNTLGQTTVPAGLANVISVSANAYGYHTMALKADGTVVCWGWENANQLNVPSDLSGVVAISAGGSHSVALKSNGTVVAWGANNFGQTNVPAGLNSVIAIAAGGAHTLALKSNGTVVAWGENLSGQTTVPGGLSGVIAIAAGSSHCVALKSNGTVTAWGFNHDGQISVPGGLSNVVAIAAGAVHTVALKSDGSIVGWGRNTFGEAAAPAGLDKVIAIAGGEGYTVALRGEPFYLSSASQDMTAAGGSGGFDVTASGGWSWQKSPGSTWITTAESPAQNGNQTFSYALAPNPSPATRFATISVTKGGATIAHRITQSGTMGRTGTVITWGFQGYDQANIPPDLSNIAAISAGDMHTAMLKNDGTVLVWDLAYFRYGDGRAKIQAPADLNNVTALASEYNRIVALKADGTVVSWGDDYPRGNGNYWGDTKMPAGLNNVIAITSGGNHSLALKADGTVVGWGYNDRGQSNIPAGLSGVVAIAAGSAHSAALKVDGTVVMWGNNDLGQLKMPAGLHNVVAIASGVAHTVALKADGTVVAWGNNSEGQTKIPAGLKGVTAIAAGIAHTLALKTDGTVVAWGRNASGQTKVPAHLMGVIGVSGGGAHSVALVPNLASLSLFRDVPETSATLDQAGTVALKTTPAGNASPLPNGSTIILPGTLVTLTATAKAGYLFSHWNGLPAGAQETATTVTFAMPAASLPEVTAVFIANPFLAAPFKALGAKPAFQGLLRPQSPTPAGNATAGFIDAAITPAQASLTGKISLDGKVTSYTATMRGDGSVWFKVGKDVKLSLPLLDGKAVGKSLTATWSTAGIAATVSGPHGASTALAKPPLYAKANPIAANSGLMDSKGKQGYFTLALQPPLPASPAEAATYPQGAGYCGLTLTNDGVFKITGALADGAKITASGFLVAGNDGAVFLQLPTPGAAAKDSCLLGIFHFDPAQPGSDVSSANLQWFRAPAETKATVAQSYRAGWPNGITLETIGALYNGTQTVHDTLGLDSPVPEGNAALDFDHGQLTGPVGIVLNINASKVQKLNALDKSFTLAFTPATGLFSGTFTPNWPKPTAKLPAFQGILIQKGSNKSGRGYFMSNNPSALLNPESGSVLVH